jgi:hypothetical protein
VGAFRRSGRFGIIGVFVVAAAAAAIALTMGSGQAKPKGALALIFGIIAAFIVVLFVLQSRDLSRVEAAEAGAQAPAAGGTVANPATLDEPALWAAMAIGPIDADAIRARKEIWRGTRQSVHTAMLVCLLIFLTVPPIYLLDTFVPLYFGVPAIAGIALWKSARLLAGGGDLDQAYDRAGRAMAPLGLAVTERLTVRIEPKSVQPFRMGPGVHGAVVLTGERHGRAVTVRMPADEGVRARSEVRVAAPSPDFELRSRDGRVKAADGAPPAVVEALRAVPNSPRWKGVRGHGGDGVIAIERKGGGTSEWLLDLWLAERLAEALQR